VSFRLAATALDLTSDSPNGSELRIFKIWWLAGLRPSRRGLGEQGSLGIGPANRAAVECLINSPRLVNAAVRTLLTQCSINCFVAIVMPKNRPVRREQTIADFLANTNIFHDILGIMEDMI
jgi:hypothetical protein